MWEVRTETDISRSDWINIYKINSRFQYKKFAEFKYKILLNFLSCGERVNKWNSEVSKLCDFCHEIENVAHMLYQCNRVKHIWRLIGEQLKITVKLKHIILGALNKTHTSEVRNLIVVIVAYSIYSSWNKCKFGNIIIKR